MKKEGFFIFPVFLPGASAVNLRQFGIRPLLWKTGIEFFCLCWYCSK